MRVVNLLIKIRLGNEIVLGQIVTISLETTGFVEDALSHETRHSSDAIDADQVDKQIHSAVARSEVDLLERAGKSGPIASERHLVHETNFVRH